jgi:hypothetical protein
MGEEKISLFLDCFGQVVNGHFRPSFLCFVSFLEGYRIFIHIDSLLKASFFERI